MNINIHNCKMESLIKESPNKYLRHLPTENVMNMFGEWIRTPSTMF